MILKLKREKKERETEKEWEGGKRDRETHKKVLKARWESIVRFLGYWRPKA